MADKTEMKIKFENRDKFKVCGYVKEADLENATNEVGQLWDTYENELREIPESQTNRKISMKRKPQKKDLQSQQNALTAIIKMNTDKKRKFIMNNVKIVLFLLTLCSMTVTNVSAQNESDISLTAEKQKKVICSFADTLAKYYFFQDSVKMIVETLDLAYQNGMFSSITNDSLFAVSITKLVRATVSDNHLGVRYEKGLQPSSPSRMVPRTGDNVPPNMAMANNRRSPIEFKILENNIGYLKI